MDIPQIPDMAGSSLPGTDSAATVKVTYGATMTDNISAFEDSLRAAQSQSVAGTDSVTEVAKAVFGPLDYINKEAASLAEFAQSAMESENTLSPSEIISLTVRSQEFMFHSQLTANIANRTADGVQQLFRQQS